MKEINARIAQVRKELGLSMDKFGSKIGITKNSINAIEKGVNNPSSQTLKLICNEFNVDPFWLEDGTGDMFHTPDVSILDNLANAYELTYKQKIFIKSFLDTPSEEKDVVIEFMLRYITSIINSDK